jgi:hypothetical protein
VTNQSHVKAERCSVGSSGRGKTDRAPFGLEEHADDEPLHHVLGAHDPLPTELLDAPERGLDVVDVDVERT